MSSNGADYEKKTAVCVEMVESVTKPPMRNAVASDVVHPP